MFDSYCEHMTVRKPVKDILYNLVESGMQGILQQNPWHFFEKANLFDHLAESKLLMFDHFDEEVLQSDFESIEQRTQPELTIKTDHLGHYHMLKDPTVIEQIATFTSEKKDQ